jgi:redox-sensitive bicupin YhaK (pirin superfamily)
MTTNLDLAGHRALVTGGAPLDGRRYMHWNFVSSSRERIEHWKERRFPRVPGDEVPLPDS